MFDETTAISERHMSAQFQNGTGNFFVGVPEPATVYLAAVAKLGFTPFARRRRR